MYNPRHYESTLQQGFRYRVLLATKSRRNHRQRASGQRGKVGDDASAASGFAIGYEALLWQTRIEWNEVVSDVFHFWYDDTTDCFLGNLALGAGFELLRTFGLVRWGLGGGGHVEGTGEKLSFASQAAR
ncbi:hypothetical protein TNCV_4583681 [Trichonephila clavipes]|nr:hypothetical protein TNCV_4583681 [Trichonephila clavipes]